MKTLCWLGLVAIVLAAPVPTSAAQSKPAAKTAKADNAPDFANVRRDVQTRMRSRQASDRAAALQLLEGRASVDAAKLVVQLGFKDRDADVRKAAFDVLLSFNDRQDVCDFLLTTLRKDTAHAGPPETVFPLLAVLLASKLPEVERDLLEAFDKLAATSKEGAKIATALADEFGNHDDAQSLASLAKLMKSKTFEGNFGFRRAVVQALVKMRQPRVVDLLIDLLAHDRGEIRGDIIP